MKGIFGKILLFAITLAICLVIAEFAFRWMLFGGSSVFEHLRNPRHFSAVYNETDFEAFPDDFWKLTYYFQTDARPPDNPHPYLGWIGNFNGESLVHWDESKVEHRRPILLYGNSFTQCVLNTPCFQDILNADTVFTKDNYLLNYGVGGYGVGQMTLLMDSTIHRFENPYVFLAIMPMDLDRTILSFRIGQKPQFDIENGELVIKGLPIDPDPENWIKDNPPEITSYIARRLKMKGYEAREENPPGLDEFKQKIMDVNTKVISQEVEKLKRSNTPFAVIIFNTLNFDKRNWRNEYLYRLMNKLDAPYIITEDLANADELVTAEMMDKYIIPGDGHPNEAYNRLVSAEIKKYVLDTTGTYATDQLALNKQNTTTKQLRYYEREIQRSEPWFNQVKEKAEKEGKTVEEMLRLDAIYLYKEYLKKHHLPIPEDLE